MFTLSSLKVMRHNKVVLYGAQSVGKSSIIHRERTGSFDPYSVPTLGAAFIQRTRNIEGVPINIEIWDTAGSEKFNTILPIYLRHAEIVLICFDEIEKKLLDRFLGECKLEGPGAKIFFVATKMDERKALGSLDYAKQKAEEEKIPMFFTSAMNGLGIENLFDAIFAHFARAPKPTSTQEPGLINIDAELPGKTCCIVL